MTYVRERRAGNERAKNEWHSILVSNIEQQSEPKFIPLNKNKLNNFDRDILQEVVCLDS